MKAAVSLGLLAATQVTLSAVLQIAVISLVGAGAATDALVAAQTVPALLFSVIAAPLQNIWQPRLATEVEGSDPGPGSARLALGQVLLLMGVLGLALAAGASWWMPWLFPGMPAEQLAIAVAMTWVLMAAACLNAVVGLLTTALRARERFVWSELAGVLATLSALLAARAFVPAGGIVVAAWIMLARSLLNAGLIWPAMRLVLPAPWAAMQRPAIWRSLSGLFAAASVYKCGPAYDRFLLSGAAAGSMTLLNISQLLITAGAQVIERAAVTTQLPRASRAASAGRHSELLRLTRACYFRVAAATIALALVLSVSQPFWEPLAIRVLKLEGAPGHNLLMIGLYSMGQLFVTATGALPVVAFFALGDTRTPLLSSVAAFAVGLLLKYLLFLGFGLLGLVAATSIYYLLNFLVVGALLERRCRQAQIHESN